MKTRKLPGKIQLISGGCCLLVILFILIAESGQSRNPQQADSSARGYSRPPKPFSKTGPPEDRFVEDKFVFIGKREKELVAAVLCFSRGTTDLEDHIYAVECTGHLFRHEQWLHLGPGRYEWPETTLMAIPDGPGFTVHQTTDPPAFDINMQQRTPATRLIINGLQQLFSDTSDAAYRQFHESGAATIIIGTDTTQGAVFHRRLVFTGYNRLANNATGYFPGRLEAAYLSGEDSSLFLFSADPVAAREIENRLITNFAAWQIPGKGTHALYTMPVIQCPVVDDTTYPGKPIPARWVSAIDDGKWIAEYADIGHFFYFTGFGIFAVEGTVHTDDTMRQVIGVVEHVHARDAPR